MDFIPISNAQKTALHLCLKKGLLRELYAQNLITQAQFDQLMQPYRM